MLFTEKYSKQLLFSHLSIWFLKKSLSPVLWDETAVTKYCLLPRLRYSGTSKTAKANPLHEAFDQQLFQDSTGVSRKQNLFPGTHSKLHKQLCETEPSLPNTQNEPGRGRTRWDCTIWLWSHSMRASAVESGTWQRSPSLSSASIISSKPRKSSTRCSARRPPMNGEVGDWQSKMPLEYSRALEPAGSKITWSQAWHEGWVHPEAGEGWGLLLAGFIPTKLSTGAWGGKLQQEQGGKISGNRNAKNLPMGLRHGLGSCSLRWIPKAEGAAKDGTSSANALSHPAGTEWSKSHSTDGVQRKPCPAFSMQEYIMLLQDTGNFLK